jgi:hypothetical protein
MLPRLAALLLALPLSASLAPAALAERPCHAGSVEQLSRAVAEAFTSRAMAALAARLPDQPMSLVIEHSLADETERLTLRLRGFDARIDRIDRAGGRDARGRHVLEGMACTATSCRFGPSSILHNNLYLKEVAAVRRNGCLTVGRIVILDGD